MQYRQTAGYVPVVRPGETGGSKNRGFEPPLFSRTTTLRRSLKCYRELAENVRRSTDFNVKNFENFSKGSAPDAIFDNCRSTSPGSYTSPKFPTLKPQPRLRLAQ